MTQRTSRSRNDVELGAFLLAAVTFGIAPRAPAQGNCSAQIEKAYRLLSEQNVREAQAQALAATQACPRNADAYNVLGMSYDLGNRFAEAERAYHQAIELNPRNVSCHDNLAVSFLRSGNGDAAEREFHRALDLAPQDVPANLNLAAYELSQKRYDDALQHYRAAHAEQSRDSTALLGMTQAYFGAGDRTAGRDLANHLSTLAGSDPKIHFSLGLLLAESEEYHLAVREFKAIPPSQRDFSTALNLGMAYAKLGDLASARESYLEASRLEPANPESYLRMGMDVARNNANDAIYWITQAHERAQDRPDISCLLSEQLIRVRNYEMADAILAPVTQRHPDDPKVWEALGDLRSSQKRLEEAASAYHQSLKLDPANVNVRLALAELDREAGRADAASAELREVLRLQPGNPKADAQLARDAFDAGQTDEALRLARLCLKSDPDNLTANSVLAEVMMRQNDFAAARSTLDKLVKLDSKNPRFHYLLSRVLYKLNLSQEALNEAELSKKLQGGGVEVNPQ